VIGQLTEVLHNTPDLVEVSCGLSAEAKQYIILLTHQDQ